MQKKLVLSFGLVILFMAMMVSAGTSDITIKTVPNKLVQVAVGDGAGTTLKRFDGTSDEYGDITFSYSADQDYIDLIIFIKKNGENLMDPEKFKDIDTDEEIYIEMIPSWFTAIETPSEEEVVVNETNSSEGNETLEINSTITGNSVGEDVNATEVAAKSLTSYITKAHIYYASGVVGVIILIVLIVFLVKRHKKKEPKEIKIKKLSELQKEQAEAKDKDRQELDEAEQRLKEAQEEVKRLKAKKNEKIEDVKKRLIEDEKELMELRKQMKEKDKKKDSDDE